MDNELEEVFPVLERAKEAMHAKSDYELAQKLGVTTATMSGYKKRKSLPLEQCLKIEQVSKVSLDWLLLGKGHKYGTPSPHSLTPREYLKIQDLETQAYLKLLSYKSYCEEMPIPLTEQEKKFFELFKLAVKESVDIKSNTYFSMLFDNLEEREQLSNIQQQENITNQSNLDSETTLLLTGWNFLTNEQRDIVFDLIRQLARGESVAQAVQHTINIHANVGQANAGNGNIENLNFNSAK